ncbi:hypothetical protein JCM11641_008366 [Rhodosporidiobolus odoratus]
MSQRSASPADSSFDNETADLARMADLVLSRTISGASQQRPKSRQSVASAASEASDLVDLTRSEPSSSSLAQLSPSQSIDPLFAAAAPPGLTRSTSRATEHSIPISAVQEEEEENNDEEVEEAPKTGRTSPASSYRELPPPASASRPLLLTSISSWAADNAYEDDTEDSISLKEKIEDGQAGSIALAGEGLGVAPVHYPPSAHVDHEKQSKSSLPSPVSSEAEVAPPPDGGLKAWLTVLGGWLILFSTFGYVNAFGVFQSYYKEYVFQDHSESDISWIGSVQLCLTLSMALVAGPLFDKGRFRLLVAVGSALWIASVFLIPEASEFWHAMLIQGVMGGIGCGLLFLPSMSIQSHWFAKKRNLAIGIVASGSSLGGIAFPIMLNKLFANRDVGFSAGVHDTGYLVAACLVIANLIMSPNPARKLIQKPPPAPFKQLFSAPYTFLIIGATLLNFGLWFPNFYIQVYGQANGLDTNLSFYLLAIFNAGSFGGRTIPNLIADRTGPFLVQCICCLSAGILLFFMKLCTDAASIVVFAALYGFLSGGFISLVSPVIVSMSDHLSEIGLRQGIAFLAVAGAAVGGNPIAGKLLAQNHNDFVHPIIFSAVMLTAGGSILSVGCFFLMKQKKTWRV